MIVLIYEKFSAFPFDQKNIDQFPNLTSAYLLQISTKSNNLTLPSSRNKNLFEKSSEIEIHREATTTATKDEKTKLKKKRKETRIGTRIENNAKRK